MKHFITRIALAALVAFCAVAPPAEAAFSASHLKLASTRGVDKLTSTRIFTYTSSDALATIEASNYFQSAALAAKDAIYVGGSDGKVLLSVTAATATTSSTAVLAASNPVWIYCRQTAANLGTAATAGYCVAPISGTVTKFYTVLTTVVDGDNIINLDKGGTNMTGSATITAAASAAGDVDVATVSASNTVTAGDGFKFETDGGGATGVIEVYVQITP